jgi:hypothetical protein
MDLFLTYFLPRCAQASSFASAIVASSDASQKIEQDAHTQWSQALLALGRVPLLFCSYATWLKGGAR